MADEPTRWPASVARSAHRYGCRTCGQTIGTDNLTPGLRLMWARTHHGHETVEEHDPDPTGDLPDLRGGLHP